MKEEKTEDKEPAKGDEKEERGRGEEKEKIVQKVIDSERQYSGV